MSLDKEIIDLHPEKPDDGEIRYTYSSISSQRKEPANFLTKVFGIALGLALFFLFIVFFVYVILPLIAILLVWMLLRNLFRRA